MKINAILQIFHKYCLRFLSRLKLIFCLHGNWSASFHLDCVDQFLWRWKLSLSVSLEVSPSFYTKQFLSVLEQRFGLYENQSPFLYCKLVGMFLYRWKFIFKCINESYTMFFKMIFFNDFLIYLCKFCKQLIEYVASLLNFILKKSSMS